MIPGTSPRVSVRLCAPQEWHYTDTMTVTDEGETRITVRLPGGLAARLREAAAADRRSMNSELVMLLERALDGQDRKRRPR
jgi:hypothetical protein